MTRILHTFKGHKIRIDFRPYPDPILKNWYEVWIYDAETIPSTWLEKIKDVFFKPDRLYYSIVFPKKDIITTLVWILYKLFPDEEIQEENEKE